jgi:predicted Ser/Thr protein kinase
VLREIGPYQLLRLLGEGGNARTYLARDQRSGQLRAIKELKLVKQRHTKQIELFERECATLKTIHHTQVPEFTETIVDRREETIAFYLVQEFIEGPSLQQLLEVRGTIPIPEVVWLMKSCLVPLGYLHGRNPPLYHRDIKPSNLVLRPNGDCVLIDFGAVREAVLDPRAGGSSVVGTFGYMAPEQFQARAYATTDLYALGATALHLITGIEPARFEIRRLKPDVFPHLTHDPAIAAILDLLLEPAMEDRYPSVDALLRALERWEAANGPAVRIVVPEGASQPVSSPISSPSMGALSAPSSLPPIGLAAAPALVSAPAPAALPVAAAAAAPVIVAAAAMVEPAPAPPRIEPPAHTAPIEPAPAPPRIEPPANTAPIELVPLRREESPFYRALLPGGHGASRAALLPISISLGLALFSMSHAARYDKVAYLVGAGIFGLVGLLLTMPRTAGTQAAKRLKSGGEVASARTLEAIERVSLIGGSEFWITYEFEGVDGLTHTGSQRLASKVALQTFWNDRARVRIRYLATDATVSCLMLTKR